MHPLCTYRLQIHSAFTLDDAVELADYLADLGVDCVYTSPLLQSGPGSTHGYDWTDAGHVDRASGGDAAYRRFRDALRRRGLRHVIDVVPNHMSTATPDNRWWWDVLRSGKQSRFASFFDIDWEANEDGAVVLPILGETLSEALKSGDLRGEHGPDGWILRYFEHVLPLQGAVEALHDTGAVIVGGRLRVLLGKQCYRLVHWRDGEAEINYRRFFEIDSLVGLCVEDPEVFEASHSWVLRAAADEICGGLRIDHPDGLLDPAQYLRRLAERSGGIWTVVEKILEPGESLRESWPVAGTTGYDFMNLVGGLFVDPAAATRFEEIYSQFSGDEVDWETVALAKKREALLRLFGPERARLRRCLAAIEGTGADIPAQLGEALDELLVRMPVYRTYIESRSGGIDADDRRFIEAAASAAVASRPDLAAALDRLTDLLLLRSQGDGERTAEFIGRFQQTSGPLMAKGVEDTAFYVYSAFVALNDVGGAPSHFGVSPADFHDDCLRRQRSWPTGLLASSTHDTKRSEDVRARLFVLSEIPDVWAAAVRRWRDHNQSHRTGELPDRQFEYFFYQTLVGAHPLPGERALPYFEKVIREAKRYTSWREPEAEYESAVRHFIERVLADPEFTADLDAFVAPLIAAGRRNSLAQTLIKLTAPGSPDIYQGTELWDSSLVDPDNRRPVDYALRRRLLERLPQGDSSVELPFDDEPGVAKLLVIERALTLRRRVPELFGPRAGYRPLLAAGTHADRVVAFARSVASDYGCVTVVPRLAMVIDDWRDTTLELPAGDWENLLTGEKHSSGTTAIADLLRRFPVALLSATG